MSATKPNSGAVTFVAAGGSAMVARALVNPLSVAKIMSQVGVPGGRMGTRQALLWAYRLDGQAGLLRGLSAACLKAFPHYGIQFVTFNQLSDAFINRTKQPSVESVVQVYIAGAVSGVAATLVTHPLDMIKTRLVAQPAGSAAHYDSASHAMQTILREEGLYRGLYRGYALSLAGAAVFGGELFTGVELVSQIPWLRNNKSYVPFESWLWTCSAFAAAAMIAQPFDVIRHKYMAQSYVLPKQGRVDVKFANIFECVQQTYRVNGLFGFYNGAGANLAKVVPRVLVFGVLYKLFTEMAEGKQKKH